MARSQNVASRRGGVGESADPWSSAAIWVALLSLLVFLPDAFTRWFLPKEVILVLAVVLASWGVKRGRLPAIVVVVVGLGALVLALAAITGAAPLSQLFGRWPRYEGLVSLPVYFAAAWLAARALGPGAPVRQWRMFYRAITVVSIVLGLVSVAEALGARPIPSDLDRPGALLGNATDQGIIGAALALLLILPLARALIGQSRATMRQTWRQWGVLALGMIAGVVTTVLSASRAGILVLGAGLVGIAVVLVVEAARRRGGADAIRTGLISLAGVAVVALAVVAVPFTRDRVFGTASFASQTLGDRWLIWGESLDLLVSHPAQGVGPSGFGDAIAPIHGAQWYSTVGVGTVLDSPHSWPLQAAMAGGIPLLALAIALGVTILVLGVRGSRLAGRGPRGDAITAAMITLSAMGIGLLTHFTGAAIGIMLGLLVGIVTSTEVVARAEHGAWKRGRTALLVVWFLWLAVITAADLSLQRGLTAPSAIEADGQFRQAQALRPWDADLASIAAQSLAARSDSGDPTAAVPAVQWAQRALALAPDSAPAALALGVAQRAGGLSAESVMTLEALAKAIPGDATIAFQLAISLAVDGRMDAAISETQRAITLRPDDAALTDFLAQLTSDR